MSLMAYMVGQLERLDPKLNEPLYSVSWGRDVMLRSDISFAHTATSFLRSTFGGSGSTRISGKPWLSPKATALPGVTLDGEKVTLPVRALGRELSFTSIEMERSQLLGMPIDEAQFSALQALYQMTTDEMVYIGDTEVGATGLINSAAVATDEVAADGTASSTLWADKTADQIVRDVNDMLTAAWEASGWTAIPGKLLLPPAAYALLTTTRMTGQTDTTIATFLRANNLATQNSNQPLNIQPLKWLTGRGAGGLDRMIAYTNDERFIRFPLVPIRRETPYNLGIHYNAPYIWAYGELEVRYPETMIYRDGI